MLAETLDRLRHIVEQVADTDLREEGFGLLDALADEEDSAKRKEGIWKLLRERTPDGVELALQVLESLDATEKEYDEIFSEEAVLWFVSEQEGEISDETVERWERLFAALEAVPNVRARVLTTAKVEVRKQLKADTYLTLDRITTLSATAAEALACHCGKNATLRMCSLRELSEAAAAHLSQAEYGPGMELILNGLTSISIAVAKHLIERKGSVKLDGLRDVSDNVAAILAKRKSIRLDGLHNIHDTAGHLALVKNMTRRKEPIVLNNLEELPPRAAAVLAGYRHGVYLDGLTSLSDAAATALSECAGPLSLRSLTQLSTAGAKAFAKRLIVDSGLSHLKSREFQ